MLETRPLIFAALAVLILSTPLHGQLLVTEILSDQSSTAPSGAGDYWELTNFGSATVSLGNYKWVDKVRNFLDSEAVTIPVGTRNAAGESIICTKATAAAFRGWWGLAPGAQVIGGSATTRACSSTTSVERKWKVPY